MAARIYPPVIDRFWEKVVKTPNGCWEWTAYKNKKGYGYFSVDGNAITAHRFSYLHFNGEISEGLHVLHKCDNPSCVNPEHLFLGTNQDNVNDKVSKNRHPKGKTHVFSTLTDEVLETILELRKQNKSTKEIGAVVGLHKSTISKYLKFYLGDSGVKTRGSGKVTRKKLEDMWMLIASGATNNEMGEILGVTYRTISEWRNGRIHFLSDND
jgi:DNA-binding CsgD family transcriptional regulator